MKFWFCHLFCLFVCVDRIQGWDVLRTLLNNGYPFWCSGSYCCTAREWNFITSSAYQMTQKQRRGLRGNETTTNETMPFVESKESRELGLYPRECQSRCAGYQPGHCIAMKCLAFRRNLVDTTNTTTPTLIDQQPQQDRGEDRTLYYATPCRNQRSEMNNLLNNLRYQVSPNCRQLLNQPRSYTCIYNTHC